MEKIKDIGFICQVIEHGNTSCIIHIFSKNYGMISGYIKGGLGKQKRAICNVGNFIEFTWEARVVSQLGNITLSLIENFSTILCFIPLSIINTVCEMLNIFFHKNDPHTDIFNDILNLFCFMKEEHKKITYLEKYVLFENILLQHIGFGYNFNECNISGEKPKFISPKTGNAVSQSVALGFEDRLFKIPNFIIQNVEATFSSLYKMLDINLHFINLHVGTQVFPVRNFMINIFK